MTSLLQDVRVIIASRFRIDGAWTERLSLNSGIIDGENIYPRSDWRSLTESELELLTTSSAVPTDSIQLFNITERLHAQWWSLAAESMSGMHLEGAAFQKFAKDVLEYLLFKQILLPPESMFEVVLTAPGQPSVQPDARGLLAQQQDSVLLGGINLSDEDASLVFLNLPQNQPSTSNITDERRRLFLLEHRDYPLIKIKLRPREGYWLPSLPIIMDRDTQARTEIDVHLAIKQSR